MDATHKQIRKLRHLEALMAKAESGDDWAEICRLEDEIIGEARADDERAANSQFGVGA